ncbi:MAG: ankyrin repeat domain-containing protein [Spirulinaceae cyanobacterium]
MKTLNTFYQYVFKQFTHQGSLVTLIWGLVVFGLLTFSWLPQPYSTITWVILVLVISTYNYWRPDRLLQNAVQDGDIQKAKEYLIKGGNVDSQGPDGYTALHHAARNAHREIVELLIAYEAKVNLTTNFGTQPLHSAVMGGNLDIIKLLIENGAFIDVKDSEKLTPLNCILHYPAAKNRIEVANFLIKNNADVNTKDLDGIMPLHKAIVKSYQEIAILLIQNGAEINSRMKNGKTPLTLALEGGYENLTELLKAYGAVE